MVVCVLGVMTLCVYCMCEWCCIMPMIQVMHDQHMPHNASNHAIPAMNFTSALEDCIGELCIGARLPGCPSSGQKYSAILYKYANFCFFFRDTQFMATPVVEVFTQTKWRGLEFTALTAKDGSGALSVVNPSFLHEIITHMGFVSSTYL